ncbi:MAG: ATP-binding domain-containing protein [Leptolyngbya sp. SIO3F4]|nr:ATP-binding domain-containing protein [Leptolyngbya sp. SIO3F4]
MSLKQFLSKLQSTRDYGNVSLGYATTVHKAQGATVDNAYVMSDGQWDRHLSYVACSRARDKTKLYASGGKDVEGQDKTKAEVKAELSEKMSRDNKKQLASDRLASVRQERDHKMRIGQER